MQRSLYFLILLAILALSYFIFFGNESPKDKDESREENWVGGWTASLQAPFDKGVSKKGFEDETVRMIINPHIEGEKVRLRFSNIFGKSPLTINKVQVAPSIEGAKVKGHSSEVVTFSGSEKVTIPTGERVVSDPVPIEVSDEENLAVSVFVEKGTGPATWHPRSLQTTFIAKGNHVADENGAPFKKEEEAWFWLDAVDVDTESSVKGSIAVVGSSIANGNYSGVDTNRRWPDYLARRMNKKSGPKMSILNAGITANQLLNSPPEKGENAFDRLERDVFSLTGVKGIILHQGLNDIRHHPDYSAEKIIDRMKEMIDAAHNEGIKMYGATLTPFKGSSMYTSEGEKTRQEVNEWMRTSDAFDGVIDFDEVVRDPDDPQRFLPEYDSGDQLHPNEVGYEKMAEAVDLSILTKDIND